MVGGSGRQLPPWTIHFFCPQCGKLWGWVIGGKPDTRYALHSPCLSLCLECPSGFHYSTIPGSIIDPLEREARRLGRDFQWDRDLPVRALEAEAKLHLDWHAWARSSSPVYKDVG